MILHNKQISTGRLIGKIYQVGANPPGITAMIDTIQDITTQYLAPGQYNIISTAAKFKDQRTLINGMFDLTSGVVPTLLSIAALNDYFVQFSWLSETTISMDLKNAAGVRVELSSLQGGALELPISIEVYNNLQEL